jgi:hypothetical protein
MEWNVSGMHALHILFSSTHLQEEQQCMDHLGQSIFKCATTMMYVYILRLEQMNYVFGLQNAFVPMTWWVTPVLHMQQATLTVNATRRFRYTLDLKKLEERTRFTSPAAHLRAGTHVIRVKSF